MSVFKLLAVFALRGHINNRTKAHLIFFRKTLYFIKGNKRELAEIDQKMRVTDHYPVHWQISSFSRSRTTQEVKRIDWSVLQCILDLRQNFFFSLAEQMRHESIEFILTYKKFLVALQERCTSYHTTQFYRPSLPVYLVNLIKHRRRILSSSRCSRSEADRNLLRSMTTYIHREFKAVKRAQ